MKRSDSLYREIMRDVDKVIASHLNEDYIQGIKPEDMVQDTDIVIEDIELTVHNIIKDTYNPETDLDIQKLSAVWKPADETEFRRIILHALHNLGNFCSLNWIDTGEIRSMRNLFKDTDFDGDVSGWDVSKVVDMSQMFRNCPFDGDISRWNVSSVMDFTCMFYYSEFKGDISEWVIDKDANVEFMFHGCHNMPLKFLPRHIIETGTISDFR